MTRRRIAVVSLGCAAALATASSAQALDLNTFRRQHKLPPLSVSAQLAGAAYSHAQDLARRQRLDHNGFRARLASISSTAAENVAVITCARPDAKPVPPFAGRACGCDDSACAFRMWAKSAGHRRNMLLKGITHYGLASATGANGRKYWVLELGN